MSANLIFDAGEPEILRNGRFRFTKAGGVEKATGFGATFKWSAEVTPAETKNAYASLLKEAQTNPSALTDKARKWLSDNIGKKEFVDLLGDSASDKSIKASAENLSGALKFAEAQHGSFELDGLKKGILQYGDLGEKLLSPKTIADAEAAGFKLADMAVLRKDAETLKGLLKVTDGKPLNYNAIEALFIKNHASSAMLAEAVGTPEAVAHYTANHGHDLATAAANAAQKVSGVEGEIRSGISLLNDAGRNLESLQEQLNAKDITEETKKALNAEIKTAQESLSKEKSAMSKLVATPEGQQAMKLLHADEGLAAEFELAQKHSSEFKTAAGKAATEVKAAATAATDAGKGAKLIGGGKWYSFIHSAESAGTAVEKVGKFRWGKAAAIGIPTAAVLAFVASNKGPGERAASVSQGRENEPAMAR